ncbi:MAG: glycosyltransferase family 2 protein [Myxococcota bacterium]
MAAQISVIIPTLNRFDDLKAFTPTLVRQTVKPQELVIVDAGTLDTIEPMLRSELKGSGIDLVYIRAEPGTSSQRNKGINAAKGDFFFFFDDDVLLEPDYIEKSMDCFDNDPQNPLPLGGVMGTFKEFPKVSRYKTIYKHLFQITHETDALPPIILPSGAARWAIDPPNIIQIPVCGGGRVVFRKECFEDEQWDSFLPGYTASEDVELSYRISKRWSLVQTPYARLHHKHSPVSRTTFDDRTARLLYARFYFFRKHMPRDIKHLGSFALSMVAASVMWSTTSILQRDKHSMKGAQGVLKAGKLCFTDLFNK